MPPNATHLSQVEWDRVFFKTYFEKRSTWHLLVNVWNLQISIYTAFDSPRVYAPRLKKNPSVAVTWSAVALGGCVSTLITPFATVAEFAYTPTTWNNASHLTTRFVFLLVILALTAGPTFYVATVDDFPTSTRSNVPLIVGMVQFFVSEPRSLPSRFLSFLQEGCLAIACRPIEKLWFLIFTCKFVESLPFFHVFVQQPIATMARTTVQGRRDRFVHLDSLEGHLHPKGLSSPKELKQRGRFRSLLRL
jgi:1,3-beta-glucan synthase